MSEHEILLKATAEIEKTLAFLQEFSVEARRERMATAFLAVQIGRDGMYLCEKIEVAINAADLLIAELDKAK